MNSNPMKPKSIIINERTRTGIIDGTPIPIVDAMYSTHVVASKKDRRDGIRGSYTKCMLCLASCRMFRTWLVIILRSRAYVLQKGPRGELELHRFILPTLAKLIMDGFDLNEPAKPIAVLFAAPKAYQRLGYIKPWKDAGKASTKSEAQPSASVDQSVATTAGQLEMQRIIPMTQTVSQTVSQLEMQRIIPVHQSVHDDSSKKVPIPVPTPPKAHNPYSRFATRLPARRGKFVIV